MTSLADFQPLSIAIQPRSQGFSLEVDCYQHFFFNNQGITDPITDRYIIVSILRLLRGFLYSLCLYVFLNCE